MKDKLTVFVERMKALGINVELHANYPWIYIHKINGKYVTEKFCGEHGFTIAFALNDERGGHYFKFTNIGEIFKLIRKYTNNKVDPHQDGIPSL